MPELPEVETVRRGLEPLIAGAVIERLTLNRPDLRFPFPVDFAARLAGQRVLRVQRRAKYLLLELGSGDTLLSHLGMTGNFRFGGGATEKHDHVIFQLAGGTGPTPYLIYSDPRRFGFMDLFSDASGSRWLAHLGPEPLGNAFDAVYLGGAINTRSAPIKALLLDQSVVAGLGNIYVSEALHMAGIHPALPGQVLSKDAGAVERLVGAVRAVLEDAIASGGSTLQDYRTVDGSTGYFQHRFAVYDHEGEACRREGCTGTITRVVQSGRSSFFCPVCQPEKADRRSSRKSR